MWINTADCFVQSAFFKLAGIGFRMYLGIPAEELFKITALLVFFSVKTRRFNPLKYLGADRSFTVKVRVFGQ